VKSRSAEPQEFLSAPSPSELVSVRSVERISKEPRVTDAIRTVRVGRPSLTAGWAERVAAWLAEDRTLPAWSCCAARTRPAMPGAKACRGRSGQGQTRSRARRGEWQTRAPESSRARRRGRRAGERDEGRCSSAGGGGRAGPQGPPPGPFRHPGCGLGPPPGGVEVGGGLPAGGGSCLHSSTDGVGTRL